VQERNEMQRKVKTLRAFLEKQGYEPEELNEYLEQKTEQQRNNMQKAVIGFFFKNSEFNVMPKAMNQWKRWVQQRKQCRKWAAYVVNAMNHPLFWAFRKWRDSEEIAKSKLKSLTKKELVDKIVTDEMAIGAAKSRLTRMDEAIDNLNIQRDNLL